MSAPVRLVSSLAFALGIGLVGCAGGGSGEPVPPSATGGAGMAAGSGGAAGSRTGGSPGAGTGGTAAGSGGTATGTGGAGPATGGSSGSGGASGSGGSGTGGTSAGDAAAEASSEVAEPPPVTMNGLAQRQVTRALGLAYYHSCFITPTRGLECRGDKANAGDPRINPPNVKGEMIEGAHNGFCVLRQGPAPAALPEPPPGEPPYLPLTVMGKRLTCWGHKNTFFPPAGLDMDPIQYGIGYDHGCVLNRDNSVVCWGQAGTGFKAPDGLKAKAITVAAFFNCAIQMDDTVTCWGIKPPTPPQGLKAKIVAAVFHGNDKLPEAPAGTSHACAIKLDDSVQCWGTEVEGNLTPPADLTAAKDIAVSTWDTCALRPNGEPVCWGKKVYDNFDPIRYHKMPEGLRLKGIRASMATYCGIKMADDTVVCWGDEQHDHITLPPAGVKVYVP